MARYDDINTNMLIYVGVVSAIITFVLYGGLQVTYYYSHDLQVADNNKNRVWTSREAINHQKEELNQYGWINKKSGVAAIPIDAAKNKVVEKLKKSKN